MTPKRAHGRVFLILFFLFPACCILLPAEGEQQRLPVRVFSGMQPESSVKKEDLQLFINGSPGEIKELIKKEKSIGRKPELGRHFVLSFSMEAYSKRLEKATAYFLTEILRNEDTLMVMSPLKAHPVEIHPDKEKMLREVAKILAYDCSLYSNKRSGAKNKLLNMIRSATLYIRHPFSSPGPYVGTLKFLETFPPEFLKFKEEFLVPPVDKYREVIDLLDSGRGEGERWWIHFQEHGTFALLFEINQIYKRISFFFSNRDVHIGQRLSIKQKLSQFKKQLLLPGDFSEERLMNILVNGDITYNIIFPGEIKNTDASIMNAVTAGLEAMLKKISTYSGGTTINAAKFDRALMSMRKHVDHYYDLVLPAGESMAGAKIRLELKEKEKNVRLIYKKELTSPLHYQSEEKVQVSGFSREENIVSFSIGSYQLKEDSEKGGNFGLLKVEVLLSNQQGESVYHRQNTLRAEKDRLDITLSLPLNLRGDFKLAIVVLDLIANNKTFFNRDITL